MITRTLTAVALSGLALGGLSAPAGAATTPPPASSCQNSVAAAARADHALHHAKADAAHARNALRRASKTQNAHAIAAAQRRLARAQARVTAAKAVALKANAHRRHNCANTTPGQPA